MQYSNHKRILDLLNGELKEQFSKFQDELIDPSRKLERRINAEIKNQLMLQAKNFANNDNVKFDTIVLFDVIKIIPKNFFTGLLIEGVFCPSALFGATELDTRKGKYVWKDETFYFIPKDAVQVQFCWPQAELSNCEYSIDGKLVSGDIIGVSICSTPNVDPNIPPIKFDK
ncbi:MAG: hypothetical protein EKK63_01745 [Acinetobacter sp.]|uniref:hypothetical protein n=1 Tax=Acinetobacter sp. TaxID=472 RepID=UPI000FBE0079|nr:hypothetical protein [Acinetobacter sp.]RUP42328.1 MAG: hypothetical protein EKK63_01745 [Acinetobacter sp.]